MKERTLNVPKTAREDPGRLWQATINLTGLGRTKSSSRILIYLSLLDWQYYTNCLFSCIRISSWESVVTDKSAQCVCTGIPLRNCLLGCTLGSQARNQLLLINQHCICTGVPLRNCLLSCTRISSWESVVTDKSAQCVCTGIPLF